MSTVLENAIMHTKETEKVNRVAETMSLLEAYDHTPTRYGIETIYDEFYTSKAGLIKILSQHPNWNEEGQYVETEITVDRPFDKDKVENFVAWFREEIYKIFFEKRIIIGLFEGYDYYLHKEVMRDRRYCFTKGVQKVYGMTFEEVDAEHRRMETRLNEAGYYCEAYCNYKRVGFDKETYRQYNGALSFLDTIETVKENRVSDMLANKLNNLAEKVGFELKAREGQKVSTQVQKFAKHLGVEKVKDIKIKSWTSDDGVYHEREYDEGWNGQFALFTNAITPTTETKKVRISVNLNDFFTMSFGNGWASCHTIDKSNYRNCHHSYEGQYCSGTLSYALDDVSMVVYIPANEKKWDKYTKEKRQMFFFGEGKLIQSLLYPDGRDGGSVDYNTPIRKAVQDVFAECLGYKANWILKKDCAANYIDTYGTHYPDYEHGCFNTVSFMQDENGDKNEISIEVGRNPIDIENGCEHNITDELYDSEYSETCECCESRINTENYSYVRAVDSYGDYIYFCDSECANNRGYVYCLDDDDYRHEDSCYFDDYEQEHFYDDSEMVRTEDGNTYMNETNAENDGYVYCDDNGVWIPEDDAHYDEYDKEWFSDEYDMVEAISTSNGNLVYFRDEDNAIEYGATYNEEEQRWEVA